MVNTIILFWNPNISRYTKYDFAHNCIAVTETYSWSVWQHETAKCGDRFFLVRCGDDKGGICMSGVFTSDPYIGPDWSGNGHTVFYMDVKPDAVIDSEIHQILTTNELQKGIPEFDWTGGHSGQLLEQKLAVKLESMWSKFLFAHLEMFKVHAWWRRYAPPYTNGGENNGDNEEQYGVYEFTEKGNILIENSVFNVEVEGETLTEAKNKFTEKLREQNYSGEIRFVYNDIDDDNNQKLFDNAVDLAFTKHLLQTDKAGKKYITHIIRVCNRCRSDKERIVALLHDTIEDTDVTAEQLHQLGFPTDIINAVLSVTKIDGEGYEDFVKRAALNPIGRQVKIADLEDNMTVQRMTSLNEHDLERLNRYIKAWHYLKNINSR